MSPRVFKGNLNKINSNVKQTIRKGVNIINYSAIISLCWNAIHDSWHAV